MLYVSVKRKARMDTTHLNNSTPHTTTYVMVKTKTLPANRAQGIYIFQDHVMLALKEVMVYFYA